MTRNEAIARIKRGLDFRTTGDDHIIAQLKESQRQLEKGRTLPRFLVEEDEPFVVTSGTTDIPLPDGFLREVEGETFKYYSSDDGDWVFLEKMSLNEAVSRFGNGEVDAGRPLVYVLRKDSIAFFPERDADYSFVWSYYKAATVLDSDVANAWLEHNPEQLIGHAGMVYAADLSNKGAVARFERMFKEATTDQLAHDIEQEWANDAPIMGGRL